MKRSEIIAGRALNKLGAELEREYRAERQATAEQLYNEFAEAIGKLKPSVETLLYVLEMLKFGILDQRHKELFGPGASTDKDDKPNAIGAAIV